MRALVFEGPWQMPVRKRPEPEAGPGEVVVAIRAAGICGSDVHGYVGTTGRRRPGVVMGHEAAGEVVAIGPDVISVERGARVAVRSVLPCGACEACANGATNICPNRRGLGMQIDGAYADAVVVPEAMVLPIPDAMSYEQAATIEPLAVALHAVNVTPLEAGSSVVIIGAGAIGLLCLLAVRLRESGPIVMTDRSTHRLALANRLGADVAIAAGRRTASDEIRAAAGSDGADVVIEAVGISATAAQSIVVARAGAHVTWVGNSDPRVEIPMQELVTRELVVRGAYAFTHEFEDACELLANGRIDVTPLIEHVAPLEDGPDLFRALGEGRFDAAKVILEPNGR
ncbi:MAG TPA: galactitol-1-phosphate 5-dehydrogenase [Candidatus Limnocylindrales bacterium]|nr:galactitol-1-phosphate 5-dehydrogenase [Candidatus Limnocylindrales bacterium]